MNDIPHFLVERPAIMYGACGLSTGMFLWSFYAIYQDIRGQFGTRVADIRKQEFSSPLFRVCVTFARPLGEVVASFARRSEEHHQLTGQQSFLLVFRRGVDAELRAAGYPEGINSDEFIGLIFISTIAGFCMGYLAYIMYPMVLIVPVFGIAGIFLPRIWLSDLVIRRRKAIRKALPYALDLLTLAVESGLDFTTALQRIADRLGNTPLATEFHILLREIQMGKIRSDALRDMADRVSVHDLTSVVSALTQTDELGAPLGPVLRIQSEFIRLRRAQEAEEAAMKAPVKLLFPLVVFIFPTAFIMILGPLFLKYGLGV